MLVTRILEAFPGDEMNVMGEIVEKANTGVRRDGMTALVLSKTSSAKEEGSDALGEMLPELWVDS